MTVDTTAALELMQQALLRELGDEVDLIFRYGSHVTGAMHRYSDLDISYVPAHESTWNNITVLVDDTLIDLYPLHWSRLECMADFADVSSKVLLDSEVLYQRSPAAGERFRALAGRLRSLLQPEARPEMVRKAQEIFEGVGYPYVLLRQAAAGGHLEACVQQSERITTTVLHSLAVCNQACIDTRKLAQVLALRKLPAGFAQTMQRLTFAATADETLAACETLIGTSRDLLLSEQREALRSERAFPDVFRAAYPELKGDLQHALLACEREDMFMLRPKLMSLYHEVMIHLAQALTGVEYSGFNSLTDYEAALAEMGFPELWPYVYARDYRGLHEQCLAFDGRLRDYLAEHSVVLNEFATLEDLRRDLGAQALA
jgi:predicted nucleotidyltransferase